MEQLASGLMRQLFMETRKALRRGLEVPVDRMAYIEHNKMEALQKLAERGIAEDRALALWDDPDPEFFLQHSIGQIVSLTEAIDRHDLAQGPLVLVRDVGGQGTDERDKIFLYARSCGCSPRVMEASSVCRFTTPAFTRLPGTSVSTATSCSTIRPLDQRECRAKPYSAHAGHQLADLERYPDMVKRRIRGGSNSSSAQPRRT
jgi:[protein-PII] uridylyltransferase